MFNNKSGPLIQRFLLESSRAWRENDGQKLASLLSFDNIHDRGGSQFEKEIAAESLNYLVNGKQIGGQTEDISFSHRKSQYNLQLGNLDEAFNLLAF